MFDIRIKHSAMKFNIFSNINEHIHRNILILAIISNFLYKKINQNVMKFNLFLFVNIVSCLLNVLLFMNVGFKNLFLETELVQYLSLNGKQ